MANMQGGALSGRVRGTWEGKSLRRRKRLQGSDTAARRVWGLQTLSLETWVGRQEGEGGHFYLVTKESHTIVLFSALERVGACIYQRD